MKKPDERLIKALCNLEDNPDFRVFREWVLDSMQNSENNLRHAEEVPVLYRAQGSIRDLLEICEVTATPRDIAGRMAMEKAGITVMPSP